MAFHPSIIRSGSTATPAASIGFNKSASYLLQSSKDEKEYQDIAAGNGSSNKPESIGAAFGFGLRPVLII